MARVAVILSGCGFLDGAEIREAVLALAFLDKHGADVRIFAPDIAQHHTINHLNASEEATTRNVLQESARIARGDIAPLSTANADDFDALVIPGGFGVAKNLSNLAFAGANATVLPEFEAKIRAFYTQQKPIGAICIAPAVVAKALQGLCSPMLTIGKDAQTATLIEQWGGVHQPCASTECCVDAPNRLASCSAYMRDDSLWRIAQGIEAVIVETLAMTQPCTAAA